MVTKRNLFVSIDNHLHPGATDTNASEEHFLGILSWLNPRRITVFAVGHDGYAQYPSNVLPSGYEVKKDIVEFWRRAARATGTEFYIYVSTLRNDYLVERRPELARLHSNGARGNVIDHNTSFFEEVLSPLLVEIVARYEPDGFFFDGDYWTVHESWNPASLEGYSVSTGRTPPSDFAHDNFASFRAWTIESYTAYIAKLESALQKLSPGVDWTVNGGYTLRDGRPMPTSMKRAAIDITCFYGQVDAAIESVYMQSRGVLSDTVLPKFVQAEGTARIQGKSREQLFQDLGLIASMGSIPHFYFPAGRDGSIHLHDAQFLTSCFDEFMSARAGLASRECGVPLAPTLLVHDPDRLIARRNYQELRQAAVCCMILGEPFSIWDGDPEFDFSGIDTVIIPHVGQLSERIGSQLRSAKASGCRIISPIETLLRSPTLSSIMSESMSDVEIRVDRSVASKLLVSAEKAEIDFPGHFYTLNGNGVEHVVSGQLMGEQSKAEVTIVWRVGQLVLINGGLFDAGGGPETGKIARILGRALFADIRRSDHSMVEIDAPDFVFHRAYRQSDGSIDVHLVNLGHGGTALGRHTYYARLPRIETVSVRAGFKFDPSRVIVEPLSVDWRLLDSQVIELNGIVDHAWIRLFQHGEGL